MARKKTTKKTASLDLISKPTGTVDKPRKACCRQRSAPSKKT